MSHSNLHALMCRLCVAGLMISPLLSYAVRPAHAAGTLVASPDSPGPQPPPRQRQPQSDNTDAHQGVIAPPATGDAAINKGAPSPQHFPTPVIHPQKSPQEPSTIPNKG